MKSQGKHTDKTKRTKAQKDMHHADVSTLAAGATSMLVASSLYLGVNAPHAEAHETTTDEHDSSHNLLINSKKETATDAPETQASPKHTPLHAEKSTPKKMDSSAPLEDSAHKKTLTPPLAQKKESASGASNTGAELSANSANAIERAQERSQDSASRVRTKRSLASWRKQQEEDRDFDLKNLELHKVQGAKDFNSEAFKLQQARNSAIAFLQYALSWNKDDRKTVIDETAGNVSSTDEAIGQNAILGIRKAPDRNEIRRWLDYVFWHKRGMYIVPENPSDSRNPGDVFDLYKPGTLLYGTDFKKLVLPSDYKVPEVKNINATVYVSNKPIKDNQGKLVGYRWYVRFNKNHDLHRSGHNYFTVPKGQTIVSSRDGGAFQDSTFKVTAKKVTQSGLQSITYTGQGVDNLFANIRNQNKDMISSMVTGTAEGPNTYVNDNNKPYVYERNNVWWSNNNYKHTGFAHTLKDIIYKHYWEGTPYKQDGCTKKNNSDEWTDLVGSTNNGNGIGMGPFVNNLYKYKFDFNNQKASEYQRIDYAQLIQENTGRVFLFDTRSQDTNMYELTYDTRIDDPNSPNAHNPYYAAGYRSYEASRVINYMQWGGMRFKPELDITVNGTKNDIKVDPETKNEYVVVHEGEKTKISLSSKNDKQGLYMWRREAGYSSNSPLSWQLGKADENLFNADYKETPVDVDNNVQNPYVHHNARIDLSGVVVAKPGSEMNIAWAGSSFPYFFDQDITDVYGDKRAEDDGLNAFLPNREIKSLNVSVIPAVAYAKKTKIDVRFKGQKIVLSQKEKDNVKQTIIDANKDHYDIVQNDAKHPFVVNDDGSVSFWISFNAAKHKNDRPDMQYRNLTLKASDTLSYSTVDVVPQDGSAEFSLTDANGNVKPTLTIYNHEPYTVQAKVTDTTNKMNDFLTTSSNVPGLSSDNLDYNKKHRGMTVDSSHPYVLTLKGQGVTRENDGKKTYTFSFASWDGENIRTTSMPVTVVVAPQAGRYRNKVNGKLITVEVNDPHANLTPERFVDDSTIALLSKAPSGDPHKKGVTYSWGVAPGSHATPSAPTIDKLTNKGNGSKPVYVRATFSDGSTIDIAGNLCVNDTKKPQLAFEKVTQTADGKEYTQDLTANADGSYNVDVYADEKFTIRVKGSDNSNIVQDLRVKSATSGFPSWVSSDEDSVQQTYIRETNHARDTRGSQANPYVVTLTGTAPKHPSDPNAEQTFELTARAWDVKDQTQDARLKIRVLPQNRKYNNLRAHEQTIEVNEKVPDIRTFIYTSNGKQALLPKNANFSYLDSEGKACTGFDNQYRKDPQTRTIRITFSDGSSVDVADAKLRVQDTKLASVSLVAKTGAAITRKAQNVQTLAPSASFAATSAPKITVYANEKFTFEVQVRDNSNHVMDARLGDVAGSYLTSNEAEYQLDHRNQDTSTTPYTITVQGLASEAGTRTFKVNTWDGADHEGFMQFVVEVLPQAQKYTKLEGAQKTVEVNDPNVHLSPRDFVSQQTLDALKNVNGGVSYEWAKAEGASTGTAPSIDKVSARKGRTYTPSDVAVVARFSDNSTTQIIGKLIVQDTKAAQVSFAVTPGVDSQHKPLAGKVEVHQTTQSVEVVVYRNEHFSIQALVSDNSGVVNDARLIDNNIAGITTDSATYNKDHRAKVGTQDNPYILTISGTIDPHMQLTTTDQSGRSYNSSICKVQTRDGVDNTQQTDVKFTIKEQAAQFDDQTVSGRTQLISVNKPLTYKAADFVSDATKKLLSGANGGVTSYTFKDGAPSTSKVNRDGVAVSVLAHFSDGSTKEIQGKLEVTDKNDPVVTFAKHEALGKSNAVEVDNENKTITVYRNEHFSVDVRVVDDSKVVTDAMLSNKGTDPVEFPHATITTDHDMQGVDHGKNPYILHISGKFNGDAGTGTYTRTIVATDGNGNTSTTQFKFIVKTQSERFTQDQLQGAVKEVEVNSTQLPAASDFVSAETKGLLGSSLAQNPYAFTAGAAPAINKVDTSGKAVAITVKFSDHSTATITGTLKVVDTTAPQLKIDKTPNVSGTSNLIESITHDEAKHTTRVVVYRNERFSIQAKATDNSGVINDVQRQGDNISGISDDRDSYQAANRGTKGTEADPYVLTISGVVPSSTQLTNSDLAANRKADTFTRSICAWDGVDHTSVETLQIVVKEQAAQFDGNKKIEGATKEVEVNTTEQLLPADFVSDETKRLFDKANGSETYAFTFDNDHKVDKVTTGDGSTVSVTVKFSDGSTQVVFGHLKVNDSAKPVLSLAKTPDTAGENNKTASVTQNGNTITVEVYRNEHFSIQAKASDNSGLIRDVVVNGGAISGVTNDHDAHHNEYTDKKGSEADPYVVTISGTVPVSTTLTKRGTDGHAYDQFIRTITVTDSAGNKSQYTLKLVVKEQAAQFDDSALTGATKTVEVNSPAPLQADDFVSDTTKQALQAAKVDATYTFNDQNDHKIDVITKDRLGKKVTIKATFGDGSSRLIEGRLVVNDVTKPVVSVEAPAKMKPLAHAGEGSAASDTIANSVELKQSSADPNTYNLTVWKNEPFELHIKAHDNSHIIADVNVKDDVDIQGFSNDHDAYKQQLGSNTKGTEADPYVLTVRGAFSKDAQTGSYSRTIRAVDESGNFTDITLNITLKDQSEKYRDKKVFSSNKVLAPTGFDWTRALADAGSSIVAEKFVKHTGTVPSDVTYKLVVAQGGDHGTQPGGGTPVAQKPTVVVTFSDGSHIDVALDVQTVADTPSTEAGAHAQAPAVATTITRMIVVKQDGSLITPQPLAQSAHFVRYVIEKSGEGQALSYETGMWLHPNLDEHGKIDSYSSSATFKKYKAKPKSGYTIFEDHNDTLEVKPNPDPRGALTIPQHAKASFRSALIERAVAAAQARIAQGVNGYDYLVKTGDASDFKAVSSIPDAVIEYKKNVIDAQGDQVPDGYVRITFNAGDHAKIAGQASKAFDVLSGTKFSEVKAKLPSVTTDAGYTFKGWTPALPQGDTQVNEAATYTAVVIANIIDVTNNPQTPTPQGFVRVTFQAGEGGVLIHNNQTYAKVIYDVKIGNAMPAAPKVKPNEGLKHRDTKDGWTPALPDAAGEKNATYTAVYYTMSEPAIAEENPALLVSAAPTVNPVHTQTKKVTGKGVAGATITVTFPDGATTQTGVVDAHGNFSIDVPSTVHLKQNQVITVAQEEKDKIPESVIVVVTPSKADRFKIPAHRVVVDDKTHLTPLEKDKVKHNLDDANPDVKPAKQTISDNGDASLEFDDGSTLVIPADKLVVERVVPPTPPTPPTPSAPVPMSPEANTRQSLPQGKPALPKTGVNDDSPFASLMLGLGGFLGLFGIRRRKKRGDDTPKQEGDNASK